MGIKGSESVVCLAEVLDKTSAKSITLAGLYLIIRSYCLLFYSHSEMIKHLVAYDCVIYSLYLVWLLYLTVYVSQYVYGATISLFVMSVWPEWPLQHSTLSNYLCSSDLAHVQTFQLKVDMMSLEHHVMTYQWYGDFRWWHLHHFNIRAERV